MVWLPLWKSAGDAKTCKGIFFPPSFDPGKEMGLETLSKGNVVSSCLQGLLAAICNAVKSESNGFPFKGQAACTETLGHKSPGLSCLLWVPGSWEGRLGARFLLPPLAVQDSWCYQYRRSLQQQHLLVLSFSCPSSAFPKFFLQLCPFSFLWQEHLWGSKKQVCLILLRSLKAALQSVVSSLSVPTSSRLTQSAKGLSERGDPLP